MKGDYKIHLLWSDEDKAWIAEVPELPGCMADGKTVKQAMEAVEKAITLWIETAQKDDYRR